ncbi:hypothetical protein [Engelhardtia mirabilis]|uniref:Uncharacterized protein n=1 Tax=Engelhardtia mirabilis TaxID=2528011 RepID=A0A518BGD6_9BACT|nr:hypothetical protein Pla133_10690 [Planctomycetes bacterium Pla133]QDV00330.1 hypothetical protein Pla86_10690 [Planctomycetes bacterium Pla86]
MLHIARYAILVAIAAATQLGTAAAQGPAQAAAQPATFTGVIESLPGPGPCNDAKYYLKCSGPLAGSQDGIHVRSLTVDLSPFVGQIIQYTSTYTPGPCASLSVLTAQLPQATLVKCGNAVPGCPMRLRVGPSGEIGQWSLYYSLAPAFLPILPDATLLISNPQFLAAGLLFGDTATFDFTVPSGPSVTGLSIWFQGTRQSIGPVGPLRLTNAECLTILGPSPPCFEPGC